MAVTASRPAVIVALRSAIPPDLFEPGPQGNTEVGQVHGVVRMIGGGGGYCFLVGGDRGVEVRHFPDSFEPGVQGKTEDEQQAGVVGLVGGGDR
ncbi:hypothetical protein [Protofrankia sp. BMG5.30]|uniref:hypothetical protein n=1 Tax=Protofrankia sp. BMG5.30 TaxID=1834514 RepID=UPI0011157C15|nr:hypothetical protein [Protofrankia sp. BMG5.30]